MPSPTTSPRQAWRHSRAVRLLFVDAEDRVRAPLAAAVVAAAAAAKDLPVVVGSAGVTATPGERATFVARRVAPGPVGSHLDRHRARRLTAELVGAHDLVLCMQRRQVSQVQTIAPGTIGHTFGYAEFADLAEADRADDEGLALWIPRLHAARTAIDLREDFAGADATSLDAWMAEPGDIADPRHHLPRAVRRTLDHLEELSDRVLPRILEAGGVLPSWAIRRAVQPADVPPADEQPADEHGTGEPVIDLRADAAQDVRPA